MSNSKKEYYFHFTLGPVQGFVSQARRTRDFWAGSFILSWLSAIAIKAVRHQNGMIQFPEADENYMLWLEGKGENKPPQQGGIPNRFKGLVATIDPETFDPNSVVQTVQEAWEALSDIIWKGDLRHISSSNTAAIWERQVKNFWDMSWVITDDIDNSSVLDQRKNWRSYSPPPEAGVKCMMMDGWQELSGTKSPRRTDLNKFWEAVRTQKSQGIRSDLKENESLCAMAFIKRRFSRYFSTINHSMQQGWRLVGWEVPSAVPSVSYMAGVHWLEHVLLATKNNPQLVKNLENFQQSAYQLTGENYGEWNTHIACLAPYTTDFKKLSSLDGNVFFETELENKNRFEDQQQATKVKNLLNTINNTEGIKEASPFYTVLLMDGDSLGMHMSDRDKQTQISQALNVFTSASGVPQLVQNHNGFLIYAGGDDVLAILPLEDAIPCAVAIRQYYTQCFNNVGAKFTATISAAIQFVHIKTALIKILRDSHNLLDVIAKEKTGRDALAIRVWKPGGKQLEWAQPWEVALNKETGKTHIEEIVTTFQGTKMEEQFSHKFFYKIRERFSLLNPDSGSEGENILSPDESESLLAMEYLNSGKTDLSEDYKHDIKQQKIIAKSRIAKLLKQCRPVIRKTDSNGIVVALKPQPQLEVDAALLIRFLVQKGAK